MVAWFIAISTLFSEAEWAVRLPAVLSGSVVTWVVYTMASDIFASRKTGFASAVLLNVLPVIAIGGLIITPDNPFCLFWALSLYAGYKVIETQKSAYFYLLGFFFGLGLLSKYTMALFAPTFFLFLLFSPENRHWVFRKEPYLGLALSALVFSPVLLWNHYNEWASFNFQLQHAFAYSGFEPLKHFGNFWGAQIGLFGGPLFFFLLAASFGLGWIGIKKKRDDYLYISFMSAGLFIFFMANSVRSNMEGNWAVMAYISAVIALPAFIKQMADKMTESAGAKLKRGYAISWALAAFATIYIHIYVPTAAVPMPDSGEINRRIYDWDMLALETQRKLDEMKPATFLATSRYQIATELIYYTPSHTMAYPVAGRGRFAQFASDDMFIGQDALYVTELKRLELDRAKASFEKVEPAGRYTMERNGKTVRRFIFLKCYNYKGGFLKFNGAEQKK